MQMKHAFANYYHVLNQHMLSMPQIQIHLNQNKTSQIKIFISSYQIHKLYKEVNPILTLFQMYYNLRVKSHEIVEKANNPILIHQVQLTLIRN